MNYYVYVHNLWKCDPLVVISMQTAGSLTCGGRGSLLPLGLASAKIIEGYMQLRVVETSFCNVLLFDDHFFLRFFFLSSFVSFFPFSAISFFVSFPHLFLLSVFIPFFLCLFNYFYSPLFLSLYPSFIHFFLSIFILLFVFVVPLFVSLIPS